MRHLLKYAACVLLMAVSLNACKKDGDVYTLKTGAFEQSAFKASASTIVLTRAKEKDTVVKFNWTAPDFGVKPVITYVLQIDVPADTSGVNKWGKAKNVNVGTNALNFSYTGKDLNALLNEMGVTPDIVNTIVVRLKTDVYQNSGAASVLPSSYSNTLVLNITTYALNLYVPGDYQSWKPEEAPILAPIAGRTGMYEGYVNITGSGKQYFKFTNSPDWDHTNYGDGGGGTFSTDGNAEGLSVPESGYYEMIANLNNNTWRAIKTIWGVVGDASPGGWDNDTDMTYDPVTRVWTVTLNMKKNGSFKFRANDGWGINFGLDNSGKLFYADNLLVLENPLALNNLSVPEDGNYTITLDLHVAGKYSYTIKKN